MKATWIPDNRLRLLENGEDYYKRVFEAIRNARREVLLETFILFDDKVGRELQQALMTAAGNGAEVHVLIDGWGSPDLTASFTQPLIDAGVRLRAFEPVKKWFGARINILRRMHRKLLVVDGECAFVGGINYSVDHLAEFGVMAKQDYAVEVQGPLVDTIHAFCRASLTSPQPKRVQWCERIHGSGAVRDPGHESEVAVCAFLTRDNGSHRDDIERQYRHAMRGARNRVVIANAYFFPGWRLLKDLRAAAKRGVQVDLILQGMPDQRWVKAASEMLYAHLLRVGVRIHEYFERPLHGKVAVIDGRWATVGSSNLDPTSLGLNLEANVFMRDRAFATDLLARLDVLIAKQCRAVELVAKPGRLESIWYQFRTALVFHFLRRYPLWATPWTSGPPKVAPLRSDAA
ncbi:MAG: cardiolipin synthase ClsB [Pseudomonadota bacterium]|nr:cardiolipin synthase ClsB [Pseudomonadota bacterium]